MNGEPTPDAPYISGNWTWNSRRSISTLAYALCLGGRERKTDATCKPKCSSSFSVSSFCRVDKMAVSMLSIVALFFFFLGGTCSAVSPRLDPVSLLEEDSLEGADSRELGPGMSSVESSVVLTQQNKYNEHTIGTINSVTHVSEKRWLPSFSFSFSLVASFTCTSAAI